MASKTGIKGRVPGRVLRAMLSSVCRGGKVDAGLALHLLLLPLLADRVAAMDCSRWCSKLLLGIWLNVHDLIYHLILSSMFGSILMMGNII